MEGTYYIRPYVGGMVTWQIHPDGVAWLKRQGVHIGGHLPDGALTVLRDNHWAYTRDESPFWGDVDWTPDWDVEALPSPVRLKLQEEYAKQYPEGAKPPSLRELLASS